MKKGTTVNHHVSLANKQHVLHLEQFRAEPRQRPPLPQIKSQQRRPTTKKLYSERVTALALSQDCERLILTVGTRLHDSVILSTDTPDDCTLFELYTDADSDSLVLFNLSHVSIYAQDLFSCSERLLVTTRQKATLHLSDWLLNFGRDQLPYLSLVNSNICIAAEIIRRYVVTQPGHYPVYCNKMPSASCILRIVASV